MPTTLLVFMFLCAVVPCALFLANLKLFAPPPAPLASTPHIAVLIPARNEEANIAGVLASVLGSLHARLEVVVLDDHSTDATAALVQRIADTLHASDAPAHSLRVLASRALPAGWNGKQHACWQLAQASTAPHMLFLDADVRLSRDAVARMAAFQHATGAKLVSGFPRLITVGLLEQLLLPLIHFVLLGFLPIARMRRSVDASLAAGCGQFLLCERDAYFAAGGHAAIRNTMHDGLLLPRAFRSAGFGTDLADITALAEVRMYDTPAKVWQGLAKNATEGLAAPARIVPLTLLLLLGEVVPTIAVVLCSMMLVSVYVVGAAYDHPVRIALGCAMIYVAATASYVPRLLAIRRFRQPVKSALLHPLGITLLLCVQWYAFVRERAGRPVGWRNRSYASTTGTEV